MKTPRLLRYELSPRVEVFSTMRHGGYGVDNYREFNINQYCGDSSETVRQNRKALCKEIGIEEKQLVLPHQVHGVQGTLIGRNFFLQPDTDRLNELEEKDYLATCESGVCIGVSTADCVPVLLFDEKDNVAIAIHAGWRGTLQRISYKAVMRICDTVGCSPQNFKAVIGPSISLTAFEVGDEVYGAFASSGFIMQEISVRINGKWHIDLWKANVHQLVEAGVDGINVHVSGICTYANYENYFSARRLGTASGRIFSGIYIKQKP